MATVFKTFLNNDVATTRTLLNEAIPIDGKIMFGSYDEPIDPPNGNTSNVKYFPHEMFQSVYDYPYLKSSSNHIFDITLGYSSDTFLDTDEVTYPDAAQAKKRALYNQFAQIMVGYDSNGNILKFDEDGNILDGGDKYDEAYLLSVARLLNKDEMKKGSFYLQLDFAVTEPGQRLYTDPGSPPAWPVAENPTLSFKDFAAKTSCPAGFFECNTGSNASAVLNVTTNFGPDDTLLISGGDYTYQFVASSAAPVALGVVEVNQSTDIATTLQNLTDAINGTGSESDSTYRYATDTGPSPDVKASFDGAATVTITAQASGTPGQAITLTVTPIVTTGGVGTITTDASAAVPFNASPTVAGPVALDLDDDTLINSDDYRRISMIITDEGAQNDYRVNSPAGDYGILKIKEYKVEKWDAETNTISDVCVIDAEALQAAADSAPDNSDATGGIGGYDRKIGLVYYQAGVIAITPYAFVPFNPDSSAPAPLQWEKNGAKIGRLPWHTGNPVPASAISWWNSTGSTPGTDPQPRDQWTSCTEAEILTDSVCGELPDSNIGLPILIDGLATVQQAWERAPIDSSTGGDSNATGFRRRMVRMAFNNTTELNSSIYFCRLNNNEFNYSANPTYLNESKIRVKETTLDAPVSYITTVGLYSADNELLAQAKLSEPVRKDPTNEFVLRVRLDY